MIKKQFPLLLVTLTLLLTGCLTTPVSQSGGMGSVTVTNSNPEAITAAAENVFPNYGYTCNRSGLHSVSFDKNSNKFARVMWGSYGVTSTIRVKIKITPIPGTNDYKISPKIYTVSNEGMAGFESKRPLLGLWGAEFEPLLKQVAAQSAGAGPQ